MIMISLSLAIYRFSFSTIQTCAFWLNENKWQLFDVIEVNFSKNNQWITQNFTTKWKVYDKNIMSDILKTVILLMANSLTYKF